MSATPIEKIIRHEVARAKPVEQIAKLPRKFEDRGDNRYVYTIADLGIELDIDRLRRDRHELIGELAVRCELPGARTIAESGTLSIADLNLSSARARTERAKLLASRAITRDLDWGGIVEDFCQRVFAAERNGQPAIDLRELPAPSSGDSTYTIGGLTVPRSHPAILFGDGGTCKSYVALNFIGRLAENGTRVALFDWELAGDDHRKRLELLFPDGMPRILYARCERPLVHEADRLRRIVRDNAIEYSVFDSVAFAADGPPEAAEVAGRYFRAARQIGGGSLHIAHVTKAEGADKRPFGSAFWHNGARSTWNCQLGESTTGTDTLTLGLFNRKANLEKLCAPVGMTIEFADGRTIIRRADVADSPDLAPGLTVNQRMYHLLRRGSMTLEQIAEEIDAKVDSVRKTVQRSNGKFVVLDGGRIGLRA